MPHAAHYAVSVDDNIWWPADLTAGDYPSLFDHPFLAVFRRAHEQHGAKVRLNLFYEITGDAPHAQLHRSFNLSMMTDRYKAEFAANADWLHLAFHARGEFPERPYIASPYEEVAADCELVHREIVRFAGESSLEMATTVHFGECSAPGRKALMDRGIHTLMGYMTLNSAGKPFVSYELTPGEISIVRRRNFWRDERDGMTYSTIAAVMNLHSPTGIVAQLERDAAEHPDRSFVEIMIHEQYFYDDYRHYEPDFEERVMAGCRWCHEHGMTGIFTEDAAKMN